MAQMIVTGLDGLLNTMESAQSGLDQKVDAALQKAADELRQALVDEEMKKFKAPSGELGSLIPERPQTVRGGSETFVEVYPTGSYHGSRGGHERRAEEVGFVVEYGHGTVPPNPWNKRARKKAEKRINSIIREELTLQ